MRYLLFITLFITYPLFAVVDISPVEIGEKPGMSGNISGSLVTKRGNTDKDEYSTGVSVQHDNGSYVSWARLSYEYGESSDIKNEENSFAHLRYIRRLAGEDLCGELFVQAQQDRFKDINNRSLAGAGVRWRFFNSEEWGRGYFGLGGFYEYVRYDDAEVDPTEKNGRLNSYIAYTKRFMKSSKLNYISYYQPKLDGVSDYVTSHSFELLIPVYQKINLSFKLEYDYDSHPPVGVKNEDVSQKTALFWQF